MNREGTEDGKQRGPWIEPDEGLNRLTEVVIGAAIDVHRALGPGFLESVYEEALALELTARGVPFVRQMPISVLYRNVRVGETRIDFLVDGRLIVELKTSERLAPIHLAQVLSYLKATRLTLGLLLNFNVSWLREGIRRVVRAEDRPPSTTAEPHAPEG